MTLTEQVRTILDMHHATEKEKLQSLAQQIEALKQARGADEQVMRLYRSFFQLKAEMDNHMMKEEMILFPMIERSEATSGAAMMGCGVQGPISQMLYEHREAKELLLQITDATKRIDGIDQGLSADVTWLNDDLYEHIRKEEEELFPGALRLCGVEA